MKNPTLGFALTLSGLLASGGAFAASETTQERLKDAAQIQELDRTFDGAARQNGAIDTGIGIGIGVPIKKSGRTAPPAFAGSSSDIRSPEAPQAVRTGPKKSRGPLKKLRKAVKKRWHNVVSDGSPQYIGPLGMSIAATIIGGVLFFGYPLLALAGLGALLTGLLISDARSDKD